MKISIKTLIESTNGMNPIQFETYCETNKIQIEWLDVTLTDFNDGFYNVILTQYGNAEVFASDGSPIEINK